MSHSALIDNLRTRGEEQIRAIRQEAQAEIDKLQAEAAQRLAEAESACLLTTAQRRETVRRRLAVTAQRQASTLATRAEQELDRRLYARAKTLLGELQNGTRARLFVELAAQVPAGEWQTVTVNPEDQATARQSFPEAEIKADSGITGGLVANKVADRVTVINTLEKRLERLWPLLSP
jgi:vacuolar-type H+-ATPase subunit E/Vma4